MTSKSYDHLIFIGRFQLPHFGHFNVIHKALELADHVLIIIGSANVARSVRNPFTAAEREQMLLLDPVINKAWDEGRLSFDCVNDYHYTDSEWVADIQRIADDQQLSGRIGLIGHAKDNTSYYLKLFPQWGSEDVPDVTGYSSTNLRNMLYDANSLLHYNNLGTKELYTHNSIARYVHDFMLRDEGKKILEEAIWTKKYKELWSKTPYPVIFHTVDAVVIQSGHILLIKRGAMPGKGMWALPGGYVNPDETLKDAALRELNEETRLQKNYPELKLDQYIVRRETFDDPHRSDRGRVITDAFLIRLPDRTFLPGLPKVKGSDDAAKAQWVPLAKLRADQMFEDHYHIVRKMTASL